MGRVLQCALIAFLAIANVFAVLIFSEALFQTLAASMVKLIIFKLCSKEFVDKNFLPNLE